MHSRKTQRTCFGGGFPNDRISHTLACPKFLEMFFRTCGIQFFSLDFCDIALLCGPWISSSVLRMRFALVASHVCFLCYHSCKHGSHLSDRLVLHKLFTYSRRHPKTAKFLRHLKYAERNMWMYDEKCLGPALMGWNTHVLPSLPEFSGRQNRLQHVSVTQNWWVSEYRRFPILLHGVPLPLPDVSSPWHIGP